MEAPPSAKYSSSKARPRFSSSQGRRHDFESGGTNRFANEASEKKISFVPVTFGILGYKRIISVLQVVLQSKIIYVYLC
jgi:hypothetical protein